MKLISWASEQHPKSNNSAKLKNNQQTSITCWQQGAYWWISELAQEKRGEAKKQASNKPTQQKPNSKAGWLVGHRADLQNLRTSHTPLRRSWLRSCCWKTGKKLVSLPNHLVRIRHSFYLNANVRTGCWRSNTRTIKTEILLFLNLECFYVFVYLFVLFPIGLSTSPCWFLWFSFFFLSWFC
jgi:hypothetical protein